MRKQIIKDTLATYLVVFFVLSVLSYIAGAFNNWSLNPLFWDPSNRTDISWFVLWVTLIGGSILAAILATLRPGELA